MRAGEEIRIVDIALLPACCNRGVGTTLLRGLQSEAAAAGKPRLRASRFRLRQGYSGQDGGQAAAHPRRALQSRAASLRAARVSADRRSGRLSVHGVEALTNPKFQLPNPKESRSNHPVKAAHGNPAKMPVASLQVRRDEIKR
jgi:hypothetical protein